MQVLQILKKKADDSVVTVAPGMTIAEVAEVLSMRRIGAVLVSLDGKTREGIVSERDIVREIGRKGADCLHMPIETIMTRNVQCCAREDTTVSVLERMSAGNFRHMPVLQGSELVGLISIRDVVAARLDELHMEKEALTGMIMGN